MRFKEFLLESRQIIDIPLHEIHREGGHPVEAYQHTQKVKEMRQKIRAGKRLPPVEVSKITGAKHHGEDIDPSKRYYLHEGNHRFAAHHYEGKTHIKATNYYANEKL